MDNEVAPVAGQNPVAGAPGLDQGIQSDKEYTTMKYRHYPLLEGEDREHFESFINGSDPDTCWLWQGTIQVESEGGRFGGYGVYWYKDELWLAHVLSYVLYEGDNVPGMHIDHVKERGCTNRACVNPFHLEMVTPYENLMRSDNVVAVNARKTKCKHGHTFTDANTIWRNRPEGGRICRTCKNNRRRKS